nr:hypothetical protein [Marinicella sp. W31]MDC2877430.1 hypothetical protein [Marinicella sp. W31]
MMGIFSKANVVFVAATALSTSMVLMASNSAYAQSAGQIVQPTYAPPVVR